MIRQHAEPARSPNGAASIGAHLAAVFCFSAGPVGIVVQKLLTASFSPFAIIAVQMTVGGAALWLVSLMVSRARLAATATLKGLLLGVVHPGGFMILYTAASARLDSVTVVLLSALMPAATAMMARLVLKEALKPIVMLGLFVSLVGLFVLVSDRQAMGESEPLGYLLAIAGIVVAASGVVAGRALSGGAVVPWYRLAPLQVTGAGLTAWSGVVLFGLDIDVSAVAGHWVPFAYLALGMTAASYLAYTFALSRVPVPVLSLYVAAGPAVGTIAATILFDETLGSTALLGIVLILLGAAIPHLRTLLARSR